jgi:hypothetical protein
MCFEKVSDLEVLRGKLTDITFFENTPEKFLFLYSKGKS